MYGCTFFGRSFALYFIRFIFHFVIFFIHSFSRSFVSFAAVTWLGISMKNYDDDAAADEMIKPANEYFHVMIIR